MGSINEFAVTDMINFSKDFSITSHWQNSIKLPPVNFTEIPACSGLPQNLSLTRAYMTSKTIPYLSRKGIRICRPTLACFLLASPIAAAASAAAAAADGLRTSFVGVPDWKLWCTGGFTLVGLKWAAKASTRRIVALALPSTISETETKTIIIYNNTL